MFQFRSVGHPAFSDACFRCRMGIKISTDCEDDKGLVCYRRSVGPGNKVRGAAGPRELAAYGWLIADTNNMPETGTATV